MKWKYIKPLTVISFLLLIIVVNLIAYPVNIWTIAGTIFFLICLPFYINEYLPERYQFFKKSVSHFNPRTIEEQRADFGNFEYMDGEFRLQGAGGMDHAVKWTEVIAIIGYKADLFSVDEVRLDVFCEHNISFTIDEETRGWYQFVERSKSALSSIDPQWDRYILFPPFKTNLTLVYDREKRTLEEVEKLFYRK